MVEIIIRAPKNEDEFEQMYDLRWRLLRKPWNQPKGTEQDDREDDSYQLIVLLNGKIIATIRYQQNEGGEGQFRYLAVDEEYQRKGIASMLIRRAESIAISKGSNTIILNGRKSAAALFENLGYKVLKEGHTLYGKIEHFVFWKKIVYSS